MKTRHIGLALIAYALAACGGGGGGGSGSASPAAAPAPAPGPAAAPGTGAPAPAPTPGTPAPAPAALPPGGLYVGYYAEDPLDNPEDPTPGTFYLSLPPGNAPFAGEMSFTYVGCQSANVGTVSGTKAASSLSGTWSGTVDGNPVGGPYAGVYDATAQRYSGTYQNAGGRRSVSVPGCIDYIVASRGTWAMTPVGTSAPAGFAIASSGGALAWTDVPNVQRWLAAIVDEAAAGAGSGAIVRQALIVALPGTAADQTVPLAGLGLVSGRAYVAVVTAFDAAQAQVGYASVRFVAP